MFESVNEEDWKFGLILAEEKPWTNDIFELIQEHFLMFRNNDNNIIIFQRGKFNYQYERKISSDNS